MPREVKKRGRRQEHKERKAKTTDHHQRSTKRLKTDHTADNGNALEVSGDAGDDFIGFDIAQPEGAHELQEETQFHGLLEPQEQEYYANVNNKIVANDFESAEDRATFIEAVHRETEGKELKVASSQSCSRYLEKIIMLSTPEQLRRLFSKFLGNLSYLVQHRFGSHCCEMLFLQAAKHVEKEHNKNASTNDDLASMENLFLQAAEELEPNMGFLLTERFASHIVRVLFLILSGESLDDDIVKAMLASKKKEKLDAPASKESELPENRRAVPKSFRTSLDRLIRSGVSTLDTTYLRALATHPTGNPVLQLLIQLELSASGKIKLSDENSVFHKLLPDPELEEDSESAKFIAGLIYDPTGSHLVETLVKQMPGKQFKKLYKNVLKSRLRSMSKNDTASYVAIRILERLGKDDLAEAKELIVPGLPILVSRRRTGLIKVLIERCAIRGVDLQDVADVIRSEYTKDDIDFLSALLDFKRNGVQDKTQKKGSESEKSAKSAHKTDVHGSLLAQAILQTSDICNLVQDSLLAVDVSTLTAMCQDSASSRVVQTALSPTEFNIQFRRHFVPRFYDQIATLAQDLTGSYVSDALWSATDGLHFMKQRLARDLANNESQLRDSPFGRNVWKNWAMDIYSRRPGEWQALAKGQERDQPQGGPQQNAPTGEKQKSAIELARERHAQKKSHSTNRKRNPATGANAAISTNA
ncbi:Nucleolar protein 9 [Cladophialophora chaetospira]|uniref:Nucleolar protein 9 n=1 Tax=Cladophialophora chaetospira TaxID=386627 RepID=A0AA38WZB2_9EURO|nr:Nucleolar protein 9 [Cladophialophora chaetospira]